MIFAIDDAVSLPLIVAAIGFAGILVTSATALVVALLRMKRANTAEHGEVITHIKLLTVGQEQMSNVLIRHIEHDHNQGAQQ